MCVPFSHLSVDWTDGTAATESEVADPAVAAGSGYTESKWVAERILVAAAEDTSLTPVIIRVGQLSGGRNGSWNPTEWFPSLVRSAQLMQCLPEIQGVSTLPLWNLS